MDLFPAYKIGLNPNAKEFVPASSRSSGGGSDFVIRDPKSDHAFLQRLKESRGYWNLDEVPSYMKPHKKLKCATCKLNKHPKNLTLRVSKVVGKSWFSWCSSTQCLYPNSHVRWIYRVTQNVLQHFFFNCIFHANAKKKRNVV